jgi:hypothetical protein
MASYVAYGRSSILGLTALIAGGLGLVLYFFQPIGIVLGVAGMLLGIFGVLMHFTEGGRPLRVAMAGLLLSAAALATGLAVPAILRMNLRRDGPVNREESPYTPAPAHPVDGR